MSMYVCMYVWDYYTSIGRVGLGCRPHELCFPSWLPSFHVWPFGTYKGLPAVEFLAPPLFKRELPSLPPYDDLKLTSTLHLSCNQP